MPYLYAVTEYWQDAENVRSFVGTTRGAIPYSALQFEMARRVVEKLLGRPPSRVVDLGAGDGVFARELLQHHPHVPVVLLDYSEPMLALARKSPPTAKSTFALCDLSKEGWASSIEEAPDLVVSAFALHHLPHSRQEQLFAEVFSLLAPGGIFVNLDQIATATPGPEGVFLDVLAKNIVERNPSLDLAKTRASFDSKSSDVDFPASTRLLVEWMTLAGFTDVDCYLQVLHTALMAGRKAPRRK